VDETGLKATGYSTRVTNLADLVYVTGRTEQYTTDAMRDAIALAQEPGGTHRIWLIRTHLGRTEELAWKDTFRTLAVHAESIRVGIEPLTLIDLPSPHGA
jgi:hypothetical protein